MERVELALYLLCLAKRNSLFLLAAQCEGFKFNRVDALSHFLAHLPYGVCLATDGYHSREAVLDMLLCRNHTVKFLVGKFLRFFFVFGHVTLCLWALCSMWRGLV